jgi:hypothetical protein
MKTTVAVATLVTACLLAAPAHAGLGSKAAGELAELIMKKFGKEVAEEGVEKLTGRLLSAAARHGDDVLVAVRKIGPKAINLADDAGENAPRVLRLLSSHGDDAARVLSHPQGMALFGRFGDDAVEVLIKHRGVGEGLLEGLGQPAIKALGAVSPQAGRRMAMMTNEMAASGRAAEMMGVIAKHGDTAMDFIWRHKAVLAGGAALTAFLANPEPYLNGTTKLVSTVAENGMRPAIVATGTIAQEAAAFIRWTVTILLLMVGAGMGVAIKAGVHKNPVVRIAGKAMYRRVFKQPAAAKEATP